MSSMHLCLNQSIACQPKEPGLHEHLPMGSSGQQGNEPSFTTTGFGLSDKDTETGEWETGLKAPDSSCDSALKKPRMSARNGEESQRNTEKRPHREETPTLASADLQEWVSTCAEETNGSTSESRSPAALTEDPVVMRTDSFLLGDSGWTHSLSVLEETTCSSPSLSEDAVGQGQEVWLVGLHGELLNEASQPGKRLAVSQGTETEEADPANCVDLVVTDRGYSVEASQASSVASTDLSRTMQTGSGHIDQTSATLQDSVHKNSCLPPHCGSLNQLCSTGERRHPVRPMKEHRGTPTARPPLGSTRAMAATNKTLRATAKAPPKPDVRKGKSKVQPRSAAAAASRKTSPTPLRISAKENTAGRGLSEAHKGHAVTASEGTKEPLGPRTTTSGVRAAAPAPAPAPAPARRLTLPVARLRLVSSSKDGRSNVPKTAPAMSPAVSTNICKASDKPTSPPVSGGPQFLGGALPSKAGGIRSRASTLPGKSATGYKASAVPNGVLARPTPLHRTASAPLRPATALPVDRAKKRAGGRSQPAPVKPQSGPLPRDARSPRAPSQDVQQLRNLHAAGGRRFEAIVVVMQHILAERDEAVKRCTDLTQELVTLREELVNSVTSCSKLEKEKDELRMAFEGVLRKAQERHQGELEDLEEQLGAFYSAEWEKVHQAYQLEADKCRGRMQQQVNDLRSKHEALEKELRAIHTENMESLRQHYETSFEELRKNQEEEKQTLAQSLKEMDTTLSEKVEDLTRQNIALNEKLKAEEENRRLLAEKNQNSHTLYLQQELDSLKVVLDLKNTELHQQNKKLMELKTLRETNLNLEGCLRTTQQENEDLRARLEEHTALHRQLSTEQVALQQTILKESKMNNRLSLQNEELLWKLQNGDLWTPRNLPPFPALPVLLQVQLLLQCPTLLQLAPQLQGAFQEKGNMIRLMFVEKDNTAQTHFPSEAGLVLRPSLLRGR
ncbi:hypothetical protein AGOR_G00191890 [Albula goreensis]|uniref:Uncharacterized protein n=1 Tax=Albula goreensis TaxID=1534307 RepID=A0A8T3CVF2_9TELE|nr:hypothetical protein AGOR_G00191890 [Albula goreensis]